jgi:oligosaccharide repeat unit polymerase
MIYNAVFALLAMSLLGSLLSLNTRYMFGSSEASYLSFMAIGLYGFIALYFSAKDHPYSLNCTHWLFILFFFFYAPFVQFLVNFPPMQTDIGGFQKYHVETNLLILSWCFLYSFAYKFGYKKWRRTMPAEDAPATPPTPNYVFLIMLSVIALLFIAAVMGAGGFISRGTATATLKKQEGKITFLIANTFCRALPAMALGQILLVWRGKQLGGWIALGLVGMATLAANHFLVVPRFWFGTIWIGVVCILIRNRRTTAFWLPAGLCIAFIYVLPFLNISRTADVSKIDFSQQRIYDVTRVLTAADFDAYSMYANTLKYVHDKEITYGNQLLGSVFFFVPRAMWKDKADASSLLIAERYDTPNKNLSEPLPAEGYIDFGIPGAMVFCAIFGFLLGRLDSAYWKRRFEANPDAPALLNLVYPFLVGMIIFVMRGSLNSSVAYTFGLIAAGFVVQQAAFLFRRKAKRRTPVPRSLSREPMPLRQR